MKHLLAAFGLAVALEGILYSLFPTAMKRFMARLLAEPEQRLRTAGLAAAGIGVIIVWLATRGGP